MGGISADNLNAGGDINIQSILISPQDSSKELNELIKQAKSGYSNKQAELGLYYYSVNKIYDASYWWNKSAKNGNINAVYWLAQLYASGQFFKKNMEKAFSLTLYAAEAGHVSAQTDIGAMYLTGEGVPLDMPKGISWMKKAAENGDKKAQINMAKIYSQGIEEIGFEKNYDAARYWHNEAMKQN